MLLPAVANNGQHGHCLQVAASSGDVRRALELLRRSLELAEAQHRRAQKLVQQQQVQAQGSDTLMADTAEKAVSSVSTRRGYEACVGMGAVPSMPPQVPVGWGAVRVG